MKKKKITDAYDISNAAHKGDAASASAGGYMSMKAKDEALEHGYDMSRSFANKSVWARIAVIAAGPLFNFILAFICAVVIVGSIGYDPCRVDVLYEDFASGCCRAFRGRYHS